MQTEHTACAKALGQEGGWCIPWSAESERLDLRGQEAEVRGGWGESWGADPTGWCPGWSCGARRVLGALPVVTSLRQNLPLGKSWGRGAAGEGRRARDASVAVPRPGGTVPAARVQGHGRAGTRRGRARKGEVEIPHPGSPARLEAVGVSNLQGELGTRLNVIWLSKLCGDPGSHLCGLDIKVVAG